VPQPLFPERAGPLGQRRHIPMVPEMHHLVWLIVGNRLPDPCHVVRRLPRPYLRVGDHDDSLAEPHHVTIRPKPPTMTSTESWAMLRCSRVTSRNPCLRLVAQSFQPWSFIRT